MVSREALKVMEFAPQYYAPASDAQKIATLTVLMDLKPTFRLEKPILPSAQERVQRERAQNSGVFDTSDFEALNQVLFGERANFSDSNEREWVFPTDIKNKLIEAKTIEQLVDILTKEEDLLRKSGNKLQVLFAAKLNTIIRQISELWKIVQTEPRNWARKKDIAEIEKASDSRTEALKIFIVARENSEMESDSNASFARIDLKRTVLALLRRGAIESLLAQKYRFGRNRMWIPRTRAVA